MAFDTAKLTVTRDANGELEVKDTTVRWRGREAFSTYAADPECTDTSVVLPPGRPFSTDESIKDPSYPARWRIANLNFAGIIEETFTGNVNDWHPHYNLCRRITQLMHVDGYPQPQPLTIELSCAVHAQPGLMTQLETLVHAATATALAVVQVLHMAVRRLFGATG